MQIEPDRTLLHYRIVEKIGEGGMGEVYRTHDIALARDAALNILTPEFAALDPQPRQELFQDGGGI